MKTIGEKLAEYVQDHGMSAIEFPGDQVLVTSIAVYPDGTVSEICEILPANYTAVRAWLGY